MEYISNTPEIACKYDYGHLRCTNKRLGTIINKLAWVNTFFFKCKISKTGQGILEFENEMLSQTNLKQMHLRWHQQYKKNFIISNMIF